MNDLFSVIKYSHVESNVGDTKICLSCAARDIDSCLAQVEEELRRIAEWCCVNSLFINADKTNFIVFQLIARLPSLLVPFWAETIRQSPLRKTLESHLNVICLSISIQ